MNLTRLRRRAAWGYWAESLLRALAPGCGILLAYVVAVLFGFGNPWAWAVVLVLALLAFGFGVAKLRRPDKQVIDRRIERASGLRHRPIAMLEDAPENDGELTAAIWQLHQLRLKADLRNARAGRIFIDAVTRDPLALRGFLLLLLLAGVIVAGQQALPRLGGAFALPEFAFFAGPSVDAWATPPAYTGAPPMVLQPGATYPVLAGTGITVIVNGKSHPPSAAFGSGRLNFTALAQSSFRADTVLTASAKLRIGPWWRPMAAWNFQVSAPDAPVITLTRLRIDNPQLIIGWRASDHYGLSSLTATLTPLGHPGAPAEQMPLSIAGPDPHRQNGVAKPEIGDSPYAGLPVSLVLTARNLAGVQRSTPPVTLTLPPAALHDRTALALAALRQQLALAPDRPQAVGDALSKLSQSPASDISAGADVQMAALAQALRAQEIGSMQAENLLNTLSHEVEAGPDYQPEQAFASAAQALEQALQQAVASGKPMDAARLQNLLAAMQSALAQHLQALGGKNAGSAAGAPDAGAPGAGSPDAGSPSAGSPDAGSLDAGSVTPGDLNQLAQQIARDEAAGQTARAQAELQQLTQMLQALQSAKPMSAAEAARTKAAEQGAQELGRMTKAESALLDQTNNGTASPGAQGDLRNQLSATRGALGKAGLFLPGLGDAAAAMATAQGALSRNDESTAAAAESDAIQGLQKAAASLAAASQGMRFDAGQSGAEVEQLDDGSNGAPDENSFRTILPSAGNAARVIQQEIIKNDSDPALPEATHQYYHRLLNPDGP
jgi:hypothetical protein